MSNESEGRSSLIGIAVTVRVAATTAELWQKIAVPYRDQHADSRTIESL